MKTIKKIWSILLVCGLILVPTISVSAAEQEPEKVEVSFFNTLYIFFSIVSLSKSET